MNSPSRLYPCNPSFIRAICDSRSVKHFGRAAPTDELLRELRDLLGPKQVGLGYHPVLSDHREAKNGGMESFLNSRGTNGNGKGTGGGKGGKGR